MSNNSITNQIHLKIKLLTDNAKKPEKGTKGSVGYDIFSSCEITVPAYGKAVIQTGIAIEIPDGYYIRIAPRSGLAFKNSIGVGAGVIDSDYRGEIKVLLFNHSETDYIVKCGDKIAQMIIGSAFNADFELVDKLTDTERGCNGYGSTDKKN